MTLTTQEKSDQWDLYCAGGMNELYEIVARLRELLRGKTDSFSFTGKLLREQILGDKI